MFSITGGVPSLIAGLSIGLLAGYGAYRVSNDRRDVKVSLFTAFFLATIMGVRFKRSKKVMPAGLVAGLRKAWCSSWYLPAPASEEWTDPIPPPIELLCCSLHGFPS
ncbi:transmembrane protein 14A isoform X2 [Phyllostomus hastatus]|uniref:transmembrane protein 14A isoform X2 n=1 Tax=Phyllostomus hastatus TaxID=9423 RepID=UPI001E68412F|nr:transmembrane protein 14A isoform X2 [Phyllostomus hastatus]